MTMSRSNDSFSVRLRKLPWWVKKTNLYFGFWVLLMIFLISRKLVDFILRLSGVGVGKSYPKTTYHERKMKSSNASSDVRNLSTDNVNNIMSEITNKTISRYLKEVQKDKQPEKRDHMKKQADNVTEASWEEQLPSSLLLEDDFDLNLKWSDHFPGTDCLAYASARAVLRALWSRYVHLSASDWLHLFCQVLSYARTYFGLYVWAIQNPETATILLLGGATILRKLARHLLQPTRAKPSSTPTGLQESASDKEDVDSSRSILYVSVLSSVTLFLYWMPPLAAITFPNTSSIFSVFSAVPSISLLSIDWLYFMRVTNLLQIVEMFLLSVILIFNLLTTWLRVAEICREKSIRTYSS